MATQLSKAELIRQHSDFSEVELAEMLDCSVHYVRQQRALAGAPRIVREGLMNWKDPETAALLRRLWSEGHSCSIIARKIGGVTKNAVIGAVTRANLPRRDTTTRLPSGRLVIGKHQIHKWHKKKSAANKGKPFTLRDRPQMTISADPTPLPQPAEFDVPRIATVDLEPHHCRWPCVHDVREAGPSDPIFCGLKKKEGIPYCEVHARRAFQPPHVRSRHQSIPTDSNVIVLKKRETVAA